MATPTTRDSFVESKLRIMLTNLKAAQKAFWDIKDKDLYASKYASTERDQNEIGDDMSDAIDKLERVLRTR